VNLLLLVPRIIAWIFAWTVFCALWLFFGPKDWDRRP
jgi:hypothetical protein